MRVAAVGAGLLVGVVLFVLADLIVSPLVLPAADAEVEWVKTAERPYQRGEAGWYEMKRSFRGRDYWGDAVYPVQTNEHGFRSDDQAGAKRGPADILFLGDSFTYGVNGPWRETFVGMLDAATNRTVANAAIPGQSPTGYVYRYQAALAESALTRPHTVVVGLDISDVRDEASVWLDGTPPKSRRSLTNARGALDALVAANAATTRGLLRDRLRFTRAVYRYLRYVVLRVPDAHVFDQPDSAFTWNDWSRLDADTGPLAAYGPLGVAGGLERIRQKVSDIADLAEAHDSRLFILIYPWPAQLAHADRFSWSAYARDLCGRLSCAGVIDALPAFRRYAETHRRWYDDLYVSGDVHFGPGGNRLVFEELKATLLP